MPNVPKNRRGSKKLEGDDTRSEEVQTERVEVTGTVARYLRVSYTVAGSTGSATPVVAFARRN